MQSTNITRTELTSKRGVLRINPCNNFLIWVIVWLIESFVKLTIGIWTWWRSCPTCFVFHWELVKRLFMWQLYHCLTIVWEFTMHRQITTIDVYLLKDIYCFIAEFLTILRSMGKNGATTKTSASLPQSLWYFDVALFTHHDQSCGKNWANQHEVYA